MKSDSQMQRTNRRLSEKMGDGRVGKIGKRDQERETSTYILNKSWGLIASGRQHLSWRRQKSHFGLKDEVPETPQRKRTRCCLHVKARPASAVIAEQKPVQKGNTQQSKIVFDQDSSRFQHSIYPHWRWAFCTTTELEVDFVRSSKKRILRTIKEFPPNILM